MPLQPIPPFYTTPPTLTADNWRSKALEKRQATRDLIPAEWRLPVSYLDRKDATVVVKECGILTEREVEITELDELEEVRFSLFLTVERG
jgi:hypothetical protein